MALQLIEKNLTKAMQLHIQEPAKCYESESNRLPTATAMASKPAWMCPPRERSLSPARAIAQQQGCSVHTAMH